MNHKESVIKHSCWSNYQIIIFCGLHVVLCHSLKNYSYFNIMKIVMFLCNISTGNELTSRFKNYKKFSIIYYTIICKRTYVLILINFFSFSKTVLISIYIVMNPKIVQTFLFIYKKKIYSRKIYGI
jgi:hypothetical protein